MFLRSQRVYALLLLSLFIACGDGQNKSDETDQSDLSSLLLTECSETTPFSDEALSYGKLGEFSQMPVTETENINLLNKLNALTNDNLSLIKAYESTQNYLDDSEPLNILVFQDFLDKFEDNLDFFKAVYSKDRCLVFDNLSNFQIKCIKGLMEVDHDLSEELNSKQERACSLMAAGFYDDDNIHSYVMCPNSDDGPALGSVLGYPMGPTNVEDETPIYGSGLTSRQCLEYSFIYDSLVSHGDKESLDLLGDSSTQLCTDSRLCSTQTLDPYTPSISYSYGGFTFVKSGSQPFTVNVNVDTYRTTSFKSPLTGAELCSDLYCDAYYFSVVTQLNTQTAFSATASPSFALPGLAEGLDWNTTTHEPNRNYAVYGTSDGGFCSGAKSMIAGNYFSTLDMYFTALGLGYISNAYNPTANPDQIYTSSSTDTTQDTFELDFSASASEDGVSGDLGAKYTSGTTDTNSTSTSFNLVDFTGEQTSYSLGSDLCPDEAVLQPSTLSSDDYNDSCIETNSSVGAHAFQDSDIAVTYTIGSSIYYYPSFTGGVSPGTVHTTDIPVTSYFVLVRPKAVIEALAKEEAYEGSEMLSIEWDLGISYIKGTYNWFIPFCGLAGEKEIEAINYWTKGLKSTTIEYTLLPPFEESDTFMTNLETSLTASYLETVDELIPTKDSLSSCSFKQIIAPQDFTFTSANTAVGTSIDTEQDCRMTCYLSSSCVMARWGWGSFPDPTDDDGTRRILKGSTDQPICEHSTNNCYDIELNEYASCNSEDNFTYYYNKFSRTDGNGNDVTVRPYNIVSSTLASESDREYAYAQKNCAL